MFTSYHIPETTPCIYLVSAYGGEWEDSWETPLLAFFDREEAETFAKDYEDERLHPKVEINEEEWDKLESLVDYDILSDEESDLDSAHLIHLQKLSPYTLEQLQQASKAWDDYRYHDFGGTQVEQVPISIPKGYQITKTK